MQWTLALSLSPSPHTHPPMLDLSSFFGFQVTVMHSMYAGYMEKAIRYSEKALVQVDRLKCEYWGFHCGTSLNWTVSSPWDQKQRIRN